MTIKDVAAYCGVAVSTVSRVLNNHPDVSPETRARVLAAMEELNYVPNNSARDLASAPERVIGVVVRGTDNPFFGPIITAVERGCDEAGYAMVLHQIRSSEDEIDAAAQVIRSKRCHGVIFLGGRYDYTPAEVARLGVPFVCCAYSLGDGALDPASYSSVSIDDEAEGHRATSLLTERGHRKIALLLESIADHSISELRYRGYCRALAEAGVELDDELVLQTGAYTMSAAFDRVTALLERRRDFTALFAVSDAMAIAALKALHNAGLRVPEDVSVIGIDGLDIGRYTIPTLTTLSQPQAAMGEEAVRILAGVLEGAEQGRHVRLQTTLWQGETMGDAR